MPLHIEARSLHHSRHEICLHSARTSRPESARTRCTNRTAHPCGRLLPRSARRLPHFPGPLSFAGREPRHRPRRGKMWVFFVSRERGWGSRGSGGVYVCVLCVFHCVSRPFFGLHTSLFRGEVWGKYGEVFKAVTPTVPPHFP